MFLVIRANAGSPISLLAVSIASHANYPTYYCKGSHPMAGKVGPNPRSSKEIDARFS